MTIIRKTDLAHHLGVSTARVSQWVRAGMPVRSDGRVALESALSWVQNHVDRGRTATRPAATARPDAPPVAGPHLATQPDPARALLIARAKKLLADARRAERQERLHAGELVEAAKVREYAAFLSQLVRDAILSQPDRLAGRLAGVATVDEAHAILRDDGRAVLERLSRAIAAGESQQLK